MVECRDMRTILFITDLQTGSRVPELAGVREFAVTHDWHVEEIEVARLKRPMSEVLKYWKPEGCILEGSSNLLPPAGEFKGIPVVHLDAGEELAKDRSTFAVSNDNAAIADLALKELLKSDCAAYAFVGWSARVSWSRHRQERFVSRLAEIGRRCHVLTDPWTLGNKDDFATRLKPWLEALPKPCGLFAANDDIAAAVLDVCTMAGISVPGDIAVIGVDNQSTFCDNLRPSLSSVEPDFRGGGRTAAALLHERLTNPATRPQKLTFAPVRVEPRLSPRRLAFYGRRLRAALDLIRRDACTGLKAADVVKVMGVSERLAETRFKAATGHRITEEIRENRFRRACELLSNPRQAIGPIASLCGWESEAFMKRAFKARFGCTMRDWRDRQAARKERT